MIQFFLGVGATILAGVLIVAAFPLIWLLSGGDLEGHHWLLDGDGSLRQRWHWRDYNGRDPSRKG